MARRATSRESERPTFGPTGQSAPAELEVIGSTRSENASVLEFDPSKIVKNAAARATAMSAEPSEGHIQIPSDFYSARDALMDWLGGRSAMHSVRASAVASGHRFGLENVLGLGIGIKESAGSVTGDLTLKIFVKEKVSARRLSTSSSIPDEIDGIPTDIEQTGILRSFSYAQRYPRPVPSGVSCGHVDVTAGTIGCLVVLKNNRLAMLSNNHILANENNAAIGDAIIQPGRVDGGLANEVIGSLEAFTPINFSGSNEIDAAVAWTSFALVSAKHVTYTMDPNPVAAAAMMTVLKNGRTTQATAGWISAVDVDGVGIEYDSGVATFNNQIFIKSLNSSPFSDSGDSGSLIVSSGSKRPVGLLFGGSSTHTVASPIGTVMDRLGIDRFVSP